MPKFFGPLLFWLCLLILFSTVAQAKFLTPKMTPVDRLVKNAEAYLAKHRNEADAHYTLARIHYLAFSSKRDYAPAIADYGRDEGRLLPPEQWMVEDGYYEPKVNPGAKLSEAQIIEHAARGIRSFKEAVRLDPKNALYQLGLASLLEEFWRWSEKTKPGALPQELRGITVRSVRDAYSKAFALATAKNAPKEVAVSGVSKSLTGHEAAAGLVRVAQDGSLSDADKTELKEAKTAMARFEKQAMERGFFTPIVLSFHEARLAELLDSEKAVDFDLRGYGPRETWPWVKPELGFLVWDRVRAAESNPRGRCSAAIRFRFSGGRATTPCGGWTTTTTGFFPASNWMASASGSTATATAGRPPMKSFR